MMMMNSRVTQNGNMGVSLPSSSSPSTWWSTTNHWQTPGTLLFHKPRCFFRLICSDFPILFSSKCWPFSMQMNHGQTKRKTTEKQVSRAPCARRQSKLFSWNFIELTRFSNETRCKFCFFFDTETKKKKEVCPAPLTLCRSGRRDVMMMMIIRTAGRVSHGVVTIPANDRIACAVKTKKNKQNENRTRCI